MRFKIINVVNKITNAFFVNVVYEFSQQVLKSYVSPRKCVTFSKTVITCATDEQTNTETLLINDYLFALYLQMLTVL